MAILALTFGVLHGNLSISPVRMECHQRNKKTLAPDCTGIAREPERRPYEVFEETNSPIWSSVSDRLGVPVKAGRPSL